jgi:hypothetical protein
MDECTTVELYLDGDCKRACIDNCTAELLADARFKTWPGEMRIYLRPDRRASRTYFSTSDALQDFLSRKPIEYTPHSFGTQWQAAERADGWHDMKCQFPDKDGWPEFLALVSTRSARLATRNAEFCHCGSFETRPVSRAKAKRKLCREQLVLRDRLVQIRDQLVALNALDAEGVPDEHAEPEREREREDMDDRDLRNPRARCPNALPWRWALHKRQKLA